MPARSFFWRGYQFPVCARCTGIMVGNFAAMISLLWMAARLEHVILLLPMAVDGLTQLAGWRESNNSLRLVTGVLGGYGYLVFLAWCARHIVFAILP